jgi:hypothetical protein
MPEGAAMNSRFNQVLREGFVGGCIGAAAVAVWFLLVDTIDGRPFFTPAMLGSAVFWGVHDPAHVVIEFSRIVGYTMIHVSAFVVIGVMASWLVMKTEEVPHAMFLVIVLACFFEFGFYIFLAILAPPLLGALAWWSVAVGNGIAALGMGTYFWRMHPALAENLRRHPLGETADGE